jgi:MerR family transcriptional regulator, thiopeptide resistance regulator
MPTALQAVFTVKQLARLAGITPRTLHYYDEIGLLKPSHVGDNGYRYYGEESLMRLQQLLFYRELDLPLEKIKQIMGSRDFDALSALESHKEALRKRIAHMERLITTVDSTICHLKGIKEMSQKQMFAGFSDEEQAGYEQEATQRWDAATVKAANKKWKGYSAAEKQRIADEGNVVYQELLLAMPQGAASPAAQSCVDRWRRHMEYFWAPNDEQLLGLADLYNTDLRFKANFDRVDPNLAEFMRAAVKVYVYNRKK